MGDFRDGLERLAAATGANLAELKRAAAPRSKRARSQARERERAAAIEKRKAQRKAQRAEILDAAGNPKLDNRAARAKFEKLRKKAPDAQTRAAAMRKADSRHLEKISKRLHELSPAHRTAQPKQIKKHLYISTQSILADTSGRAGRALLDAHPNKVATGLLKPHLHGGLAGTGRRARRNRYMVAELLLLLGLSKSTNRRGDRFNPLMKGIPDEAIRATLRDPYTGETPGRSTLSGTHRGSLKRNEYGKVIDTRTDGTVGYTRAFKNLRILYTRQARWKTGEFMPPTRGWENAEPNEIPPGQTESGWRRSLARYWIVSSRWTDPYNDAEKARLYAAFLDGLEPFEPALYDAKASPGIEPPEPTAAATGPP